MTTHPITPLGALARGLLAGTIASGAMSLFFRVSSSITPSPVPDAFQPPEAEQERESADQTVARRLVEGFAQRGPLTDLRKKEAGYAIHFGFGAMWGGLFGLIRESYPRSESFLSTLLYSTLVWMTGDNLILPGFRLAAWPKHYPFKTHAYAWFAHVVYGVALAEIYDGLSEIAVKEIGLTEVDTAISHLRDLKTMIEEVEKEAKAA